jgi:hypothetical protein
LKLLNHSKNSSGFLIIQGLIIVSIILIHVTVFLKILSLKTTDLNSKLNYTKCYYAAKSSYTYIKNKNITLPITLTFFEIPIYIYEDDDYIYLEGSWKNQKTRIKEKKL